MRPYRYTLWTAIAVAAFLLVHASSTRGEELRYKFAQGEKLQFGVTINMSLSFSGEGVPDQTMTLEQVHEMLWTVQEVKEDGTARIRQTIERIKMSVAASPTTDFQYDSASGEEPSGTTAAKVMPLLDALVGSDFEVTMNPRGEVLDMEIPEGVVQALQKAPGATGMADMYTEAGFKKLVQQASPAFPEGDLEPGREWTKVIELPGANPDSRQTVTTKYRYIGQEEVEGKTLERISVEVEMDLSLAGLADQAGAEVTVKHQESGGRTYFDRQAGRVHSSVLNGLMDMEIAALGRTMHAHLEQSVQVTVKPAE